MQIKWKKSIINNPIISGIKSISIKLSLFLCFEGNQMNSGHLNNFIQVFPEIHLPMVSLKLYL